MQIFTFIEIINPYPSSSPRAHPHHKSQNNSPQQKESETSLTAADKTYHHESKAPAVYLSLHPPSNSSAAHQ